MPVNNSVSVTAGSAVVTGYLTAFSGVKDDTFNALGFSIPILSVDSTSKITLAYPWPGATGADITSWRVMQTAAFWSSTVTLNKSVQELLNKIRGGIPFKPDATGTLAQRAAYNPQPQGFLFLQTDVTPMLLFVKTADTNSGTAWSAGQQLRGDTGPAGTGGTGTGGGGTGTATTYEFRVDPSTFIMQYRAVGATTWINMAGGDLDDILGTYRTAAQTSATNAASSASTATTEANRAKTEADRAAAAGGGSSGGGSTTVVAADLIGKVAMIPTAGGSGPLYIGWNNALVNTLTSRQPAITNPMTLMPRIGLVTSTTAGEMRAMRHQALTFTRGDAARKGGFLFKAAAMAAGVATGTRMWIGFTNSGNAPTNVEPSSMTHILGIGKDAADTNWQIMHNDGANAATKIDTGISASTNTTDGIAIEFNALPNGTDVTYKITNIMTGVETTGTIVADLPGSATLLAVHAWITNNAQAIAVGMDLMGIDIGPPRVATVVSNPTTPTGPYVPPAEPTYTSSAVYTMNQTATVAGVSMQAHNASKTVAANGYDSVKVFDAGKKAIFEARNDVAGNPDRASYDTGTNGQRKVRSEFLMVPRFQRGQLFTAEYDFMLPTPSNPAAVPHTREWLILGQIHQADPQNGADGSNLKQSIGSSPIFALSIVKSGTVELLTVRGETDTASIQTTFPPQRTLGSMAFQRGRRYKFKFEFIDSNGRLPTDTNVTPTPTAPLVEGLVRCYVDNVLWFEFKGRTGYWASAPENAGTPSTTGSYFKFGIYADTPDDLTIDPVVMATYWDLKLTITTP